MTVVVDEAALGGFDAQPGGPALAAAVEFVDPTTLVGQDTAAWMRGTFRVRNHADWLLLRALREACRARADTTVRVEDEFAPRIAAANLGWSTTTAGTRLEIAVGILERMPALGERMRSGELELAKAGAFVTGLDGLTDAQCAQVVAGLLDQAPELPLGQLRDRILSAGYAVDRVWGANRLAAATARARVTREPPLRGGQRLRARPGPGAGRGRRRPAPGAGAGRAGPATRRRGQGRPRVHRSPGLHTPHGRHPGRRHRHRGHRRGHRRTHELR